MLVCVKTRIACRTRDAIIMVLNREQGNFFAVDLMQHIRGRAKQ